MKTAISLFSGCGGDTLGMKMAGLDVIGYSELKPKFCKTHDANFPNSKCIGNDITKISDDTLRAYRGKVDVVFAGFPCQSFSHGGKKDAKDPRGQLYLQFVRVVDIIKPKLIIGENVKGLLSRKTADGEKFIDVIQKAFEDIGYKCSHKVYKCHEYGIPQARERLIILGSPDGKVCLPDSPENPKGLLKIVKFNMEGTLRVPSDMFKGIPSECVLTDMDNADEGGGAHPYLKSRLEKTEDLDPEKHKYGFSFGKRVSPTHCEIIDIRKPSKTIICTYEHKPRLFVPQRNRVGCFLRSLTPDELKQIQGFPPDYELCGSRKDQIIQVGNAVPPPLIEKVVRANI